MRPRHDISIYNFECPVLDQIPPAGISFPLRKNSQSPTNPDKHRQLHVLLTEVGSELEASTGTGHSPEDLDRLDRFYSESRRDFFVGKRRRMDVKVQATADVTFVGGPSWRRWRR